MVAEDFERAFDSRSRAPRHVGVEGTHMSISVVLVDDHSIVRSGLKRMLEESSDIRVTGEAGNGRDAVELVKKGKPDVVVMDISMPEMNGIEATRRMAGASRKTKVILFSMHVERDFVQAALEAGASGFVTKSEVPTEVARAVRAVCKGGTFLSPSIAGDVVDQVVHAGRKPVHKSWRDLTERELEVLQLIAEGHTTKEIASKLELSEKTVAVHREHIMDKLKIFNTVALARYALREGLTSL